MIRSAAFRNCSQHTVDCTRGARHCSIERHVFAYQGDSGGFGWSVAAVNWRSTKEITNHTPSSLWWCSLRGLTGEKTEWRMSMFTSETGGLGGARGKGRELSLAQAVCLPSPAIILWAGLCHTLHYLPCTMLWWTEIQELLSKRYLSFCKMSWENTITVI